VCIDASLAVALITAEAASQAAWEAWDMVVRGGLTAYVPPLFLPECLSSVRMKVHLGRMTQDEGDRAASALEELAVRIWNPPDLQRRAWKLAERFRQPRVYDAQYLAVAESLGCDLWTIDRRLANAADISWVKCLA
jgi:predicted nucleic acid-binding protein